MTGNGADHPHGARVPPDGVAELLTFVADAGKQMLESSTSVSEVEDRLRRFLSTVGPDQCAIDATMSSLIISHWRPGATPITVMREIHVGSPRLERLAAANRLLDQLESGSIDLDQAAQQLRHVESQPVTRLFDRRLAMLLSVFGWVMFLDGMDALTVVLALAATACTLPVDGLVRRLGFPSLAATFLLATVLAAIPNLVAAAGVAVLVGPAIVGALYPHLPGRAVVSSVIDGLANSPLSSISRGIQAVATAGFLALGMLVGSRIGTGLGLSYDPDVTSTPLALSLLGAAIGVFGLAVAWAMPRPQLLPTVAISTSGWLIVAASTDPIAADVDWPVYAIAAGAIGLAGALVSVWQGSSASIYTGVAILPLVPGFTLYSGMLAIAQGDTDNAWSALGDASVVSLAIAVGVALGLGVGRNVVDAMARVRPDKR